MIGDIVAAWRDLLEPAGPEQPAVDATGAEPFSWAERTLYVYPSRGASETSIETGPVVRQDFGIAAVFLVNGHEEADGKRDADTTELLDTKREQYFEAVRANQRTATWDHVRAVELARPPRTLQGRAVAIEIIGWRIREAGDA